MASTIGKASLAGKVSNAPGLKTLQSKSNNRVRGIKEIVQRIHDFICALWSLACEPDVVSPLSVLALM